MEKRRRGEEEKRRGGDEGSKGRCEEEKREAKKYDTVSMVRAAWKASNGFSDGSRPALDTFSEFSGGVWVALCGFYISL